MVVLKKAKNLNIRLESTLKKPYKVLNQAMVNLNLDYRVRASTLMETLVATVLIVIVFMIASITLNSIFSSTIKNNTRAIEAELNELQYLKLNNKLELPYQDTFGDWNISAEQYQENNQMVIEFEANNTITNKTIVVKQHEAK